MSVNVNEVEAKHDAPPGGGLPGLDGLPQVAAVCVPDEEQLEAEYYDTDDLRLIRSGVTLRRRRGGDTGREIRLPLGAERELGNSAYLAGENACSCGLQYGRDTCDGQRLRAQAWRTWRRASLARYRRWMR